MSRVSDCERCGEPIGDWEDCYAVQDGYRHYPALEEEPVTPDEREEHYGAPARSA